METRNENKKKISEMTKEELNQYKYQKAREAKQRMLTYSEDPVLQALINAYIAVKEGK